MMVIENLINVLRNHVANPENGDIASTDKLVDLGIDSLRLVELIIDLEESFNIVIPDEEMLAKNFNTIDDVSEMVIRIQATA